MVSLRKDNIMVRGTWQIDDRITCYDCKYAVWGWRYRPEWKQRFVNGCTREGSCNCVCITSMVSTFNPRISCEGYEKMDEKFIDKELDSLL